jgi:2,4-dienoyl-CoA reductase-like NADH-dependent reductase (Old Yellow Enzyme family)
VTTTALFSPFACRGIVLRNRVGVSPMCQYSSEDGFANDWHYLHLGSRAVGGAGLVFTEATAVTADGRISPADLGIWKDEHVEGLARCVHLVEQHGALAGIQLAHAGRKASTAAPWLGGHPVEPGDGGWRPLWAPSAVAFGSRSPVPHALTEGAIAEVVQAFAHAAVRAGQAGFKVVELHAAHGYLLHQFLSPLSNQRTDRYGGAFENRIRLTCEVVDAVRRVWPEDLPLFVRISATDWVEGGWDVEQSVELARVLKARGVDVIDCSSGRAGAGREDPRGPGLPDPLRRAGPPAGRHRHRRRGPDHQPRAGRPRGAHRPGRRDPARPRRAARPVLAHARRPQAWPGAPVARAVPARDGLSLSPSAADRRDASSQGSRVANATYSAPP